METNKKKIEIVESTNIMQSTATNLPAKRRKQKNIREDAFIENTRGSIEKDNTEVPSIIKPDKHYLLKNKQATSSVRMTYGNYYILNNDLFLKEINKKTEEVEVKRIGKMIRIKAIHQDIETHNVEWELEFYNYEKLQTAMILRENLQKNKLTQLVNIGCDIIESNVVAIQNFLRYQEDFADYKNTHKQLGWAVFEDKEVFKHHSLIGTDIESTYNGPFVVESKGTFEGWEETIIDQVLPSVPLTLALIAGFASPVVAWIAKDFDLEVILFHIYGDSTMGKTTAARVFVSPFGAPTTKTGGTLVKWNGTANGVIGQLVNNLGVPIAIDEASMNKMKDFTEMIYTLAEGVEKARMTKTLDNRERRRWAGVLFSTAEHPLIEKTNFNSGLQVRLMEIGNVQWTNSSEHANKLKDNLLANYGHAGSRFIEYILNIGKGKVIDCWRKWQVKCMGSMTEKDNLSNRIADKFALIMMAGEMVQDCFSWDMQLDEVLGMLIEHDQKNVGQRSVGEEAYNQFIGLVKQHRSKFITQFRDEKGTECWGRINTKNNAKVEVEILTNVFRQKMGELGFENYGVILDSWREKGFLDHDYNKFTRKRTGVEPKKQRQNYYCIQLPKECLSLIQEQNNQHTDEFNLLTSEVKSAKRRVHLDNLPEDMDVVDSIDEMD
ncbi:DUF927 domain-containing protein [Psychrobacillus sp. FSL K6-2684]|uniref:DUF927 domain-containing protein n=1 Tax=Psychrobacillus sp. FSL K6-2684 TaxID=2921547 RepID=UPI0030F91D0B